MISGKTAEIGHLVGVIKTVAEENHLVGVIQTTGGNLTGTIHSYSGSAVDEYDGEYIVKPLPYDDQTLETEGLLMTDDVTVLKIPYYETSNIADGLTVYIGE